MTAQRPLRSRFDRTVILVIVAIAGLIAGTILLGDHVGVTVSRAVPLGESRSTSLIRVTFSETMNQDSVSERFHIEPALQGAISWNGDTLTFDPEAALLPGTTYTVSIDQGAVSETGRALLQTTQFSFTVRLPRVVYLYPSDNQPQNLWIVDPSDPTAAIQLTNSPTGIYDFAVSPDGSQIAFSERTTNGTEDIKLLDLDTGALRQLTNCETSGCTTPVWRPDGRMIAYERVEYDPAIVTGRSPTRIWLIDPTVDPATTRPLFDQSQILGFNAQWSADGNRIAMFDNASVSIIVYDFTTQQILAIPSQAGSSGAFSPDGLKLVYPTTPPVGEGQSIRSYFRMANFGEQAVIDLTTPDDPFEDDQARWRPDGQLLAVTRRYLDERYTQGFQLFLMDPNAPQDAHPIVEDPNYAVGLFRWDATGSQLVVQRLRLLDDNGQPDYMARPEVWVVNAETGALQQIASNATLPAWAP
ncbi:MAG: Ig-like domain-containing protein [Anaerolineae bacterium]